MYVHYVSIKAWKGDCSYYCYVLLLLMYTNFRAEYRTPHDFCHCHHSKLRVHTYSKTSLTDHLTDPPLPYIDRLISVPNVSHTDILIPESDLLGEGGG